MRESQAIIERVRRVAANLQQLDLSVEAALQLQPGQSVFACSVDNEGWHPYLREQWIPIGAYSGRVAVELPAERVYAPGRVVSLLAPIGKPFPLRPNLQRMLLIVQNTMPTPVIFLASHLIANGIAVTLVLSGQATGYPLELLPAEVEILHGDSDWKWPDQVETLSWADQIIALAPTYGYSESYSALLNVIRQIRQHDLPDQYLCGLFYHRLGCGTGACQVCQIPGQHGDLLACLDGPALDLKGLAFK
jgi:hypothetical protein